MDWSPLSLKSTTEELCGRKSSGSGLEIWEYGWPHGTLYPQMLALTSPTSGGHSVGIISRGLRPRSLVLYKIFLYLELTGEKVQNLYFCLTNFAPRIVTSCFILTISEFFKVWPQKLLPHKFFMWTARGCFYVNDFEHVTQKNCISWGYISPEKTEHVSLRL
jgi:hypothetical protein